MPSLLQRAQDYCRVRLRRSGKTEIIFLLAFELLPKGKADSVVSLNYGKELDQTNVQTALRDSERSTCHRTRTARRHRSYDVLQARYTKLGEPVAHSPPFERSLFSMGQPRALHSAINLRSIAPPLPWWHACDFG